MADGLLVEAQARQDLETEIGISSSIENSVDAQLIEQIQKNLFVPVMVSSVLAFILAFILRGEISWILLGAWFGVLLVINIARFFYFRNRVKDTLSLEEKFHWIKEYNFSVAVIGCIWGLSGILFFAENAIHLQVFLAFVLGGLTAGAVLTYSPWLQTFYAFAIPVSLPLLFRFFYEFNELSFFMGLLVLVFAGAATFLAISFHKSLRTTIALQVDRSALVVELEQASQAKSKFLSSMSHELRTPLNSILGFSQLLEYDKNDPLSRNQEHSVKQIVSSGNHLLALIDQVLDLEKINTGQSDLNIEPQNILELFKECIDTVEPIAELKNVEMSLDFEGEIIVMADRTALKQIILNLLSNAIKYNRKDGLVNLDCQTNAFDTAQIIISDTGDGIAVERQTGLFEPFNRLGRENSAIEGTGVGLTITRRLVESMGGEIDFKSEEGKGSAFWFTLPIHKT